MKTTTNLLALAGAATLVLADAATTTSAPVSEATCTAKLTTKLCGYEPSLLAAAEDSRAGCWALCDSEKYGPCNFVMFIPGNPYTGGGSCSLYPGEEFDPAKEQDKGCSNPYLEVYDKPSCTGGPPKPSVECPAGAGSSPVASPSPLAEICGYEPPETCFDTCYASSGSTNCLNLCAKADDCEFAIFNALNELKSPWLSGNCWVFPKGKFDPTATKPCDGKPTQFVYSNACPKPAKPTAISTSVAPTGTGAAGTGSSSDASTKTGVAGTGSSSVAATKTGAAGSGSSSAATSGPDTSSPPRSKPEGNAAAEVAKSSGAAAVGVSLGLVSAALMALAL